MRFRAWALLSTAPLVWLGCNSLLGIDDASFVPLADGGDPVTEGGAGMSDAEPDASSFDPNVTITARELVRVPWKEERSFPALIEGSVAPLALAVVGLPPGITAEVNAVGAGSFVVRLQSVPSAGGTDGGAAVIDATATLEARDASGGVVQTAAVRVLSGAPGALDGTFGDNGALVLDYPLPGDPLLDEVTPLLVIGSTIYLSDVEGDTLAVDGEGKGARLLASVNPGEGICSPRALVLGDNELLLGTRCYEFDFEGSQVVHIPLDGNGAVIEADPALSSARELGGLAYVGKPWIIDRDTISGDVRIFGGAGSGFGVDLEAPSALLGFADSALAVGVDPNGPDGGAVRTYRYDLITPDSVPLEMRLHPTPSGVLRAPISTAVTKTGGWAVAVVDDGAPQGVVITSNGDVVPTGRSGVLHVAADHADRFVVLHADYLAADIAASATLYRIANGARDDELPPTPISPCVPHNVAVDEDGMIVVLCERRNSFQFVLRRYWP